MYCQKCGQPLEDHVLFCQKCGTRVLPPQNAAIVTNAIPVSAASPVPPAAPAAMAPTGAPLAAVASVAASAPVAAPIVPLAPTAAEPPKKKKKKPVGCIVTLSILLIVLLGIGWFIASIFGLFGPKDLGVHYTEKDYQSAMAKIGTQVTFDGMTGDELRDYTKDLKKSGKKLSVNDYTWTHSDFQEKHFELTPNEATALLNEIAPGFFWFQSQQIKVLSNGDVEASGTLLLQKALTDLYPEYKDKAPYNAISKLNLYAVGSIEITENKLTLDTKDFKAGPIIPVSAQMLNDNASYFEALYTCVPGLVIHSLKVNDQGNFVVDALIPQKTVITEKNP